MRISKRESKLIQYDGGYMEDSFLIVKILLDRGFSFREIEILTGISKEEIENFFENVYKYRVKKEVLDIIYKKIELDNLINTALYTNKFANIEEQKDDYTHLKGLKDQIIILDDDYELLRDTLLDFTIENNDTKNYGFYLELIMKRAYSVAIKNGTLIITNEEIKEAIKPLKYIPVFSKLEKLEKLYDDNCSQKTKKMLRNI